MTRTGNSLLHALPTITYTVAQISIVQCTNVKRYFNICVLCHHVQSMIDLYLMCGCCHFSLYMFRKIYLLSCNPCSVFILCEGIVRRQTFFDPKLYSEGKRPLKKEGWHTWVPFFFQKFYIPKFSLFQLQEKTLILVLFTKFLNV